MDSDLKARLNYIEYAGAVQADYLRRRWRRHAIFWALAGCSVMVLSRWEWGAALSLVGFGCSSVVLVVSYKRVISRIYVNAGLTHQMRD